MNDLKETAEQRASEAISEVLKSHSLTTLTCLSTDLDSLLEDVNDASEVDGINRSDIKCTLELLIESIDFAKEDIEQEQSAKKKQLMKYSSEQEKQFVDDAIKNRIYRIDYAFGEVFKLNESREGYEADASFWGLGVSKENSERFIIRAIYRLQLKEQQL